MQSQAGKAYAGGGMSSCCLCLIEPTPTHFSVSQSEQTQEGFGALIDQFVSMGPDLKDEGRLDKEASGNKENVCSMKELENEHVRCPCNYEGTFEMEALMDVQIGGTDRSEDVEVNVLECTNAGEIGLVEAEYQEATENSSSFDDTVSIVENGAMLSDAEVESEDSELHGDTSLALPFGGVGEFFQMRRKKVTPHWRRFIQPLMWRCKWVELQIRKCQSQAMKCDRMLEKYNQRKQFELEKCTLEGCGARSFPFSGQNRRKEFMKRRRRKKVEDTVDIASYMSHHNLFSYYDNKRSAAASMNDDWGNQEKTVNGNDEFGNDELLSLKSKDSDNSLEQILWKIGTVQSRVSNMKIRMNKVMSENAAIFSSTDQLSLLESCNAWTGSAQYSAFLHNNGDRMPVGSYIATQLMTQYSVGDPVMPETAALSHGKVTLVYDKVEIRDQPDIASSSKHIEDGDLIDNHRAREELNDFEEFHSQPVEKPPVPKQEQGSSIPPFHILEPDPLTDDQPAQKMRSISKLSATTNKGKRGKQQAGSSRLSRQSTG